MIAQLELYLHAEECWLHEGDIPLLHQALSSLLPELLAQPKGPDHVLSELSQIELNLVDDVTIASVHGEFLDDPTATDVITFHHGEIFVSLDTAHRYADENGISQREELFRYLVHGLVHLHGYLDDTRERREALFAIQEPLVARFFPIFDGS